MDVKQQEMIQIAADLGLFDDLLTNPVSEAADRMAVERFWQAFMNMLKPVHYGTLTASVCHPFYGEDEPSVLKAIEYLVDNY